MINQKMIGLRILSAFEANANHVNRLNVVHPADRGRFRGNALGSSRLAARIPVISGRAELEASNGDPHSPQKVTSSDLEL
jgi:hypothetical protein